MILMKLPELRLNYQRLLNWHNLKILALISKYLQFHKFSENYQKNFEDKYLEQHLKVIIRLIIWNFVFVLFLESYLNILCISITSGIESKFVEIFVSFDVQNIYILYIYNFILYKKKEKTEHMFNYNLVQLKCKKY